jgi:tetratricopeptide (TPR) repeat protein
MRAAVLAILLAAPTVLFADDQPTGQADDHLVGQKVMVIHWRSQLTDDDKKLNTPVYLGDVFTVEKVDGRLLWVKCGWIHDTDVLPIKEAIEFFTSRIEDLPNSSTLYHDRVAAYTALGEYDKALADQQKCMELDSAGPPGLLAWNLAGLARIWLFKHDFGRAIENYDHALKLYPNNSFSYNGRGLAYRYLGKYQEALADFEKQIKLDPNSVHTYGNRAWILATCPDSNLRDPDRAIESATRACELSDWHSGGELDTLAAAYASKGDFDSAVKWQTKAIEMGLESHFVKRPEDLKTRLELYKSGKPFIDTPVK